MKLYEAATGTSIRVKLGFRHLRLNFQYLALLHRALEFGSGFWVQGGGFRAECLAANSGQGTATREHAPGSRALHVVSSSWI